MIYPNATTDFPEGLSFALLFDVALAADKYHIPRILTTIRRYIVNVNDTIYTPLELYKLACRFGWMREANVLSSSTLMTYLMSDESMRVLHTIETRHVLKLFRLHRCRQDFARKYFITTIGSSQYYRNYAIQERDSEADLFGMDIKRWPVEAIMKDERWIYLGFNGLDRRVFLSLQKQQSISFIRDLPKTIEESEKILDPGSSFAAPDLKHSLA